METIDGFFLVSPLVCQNLDRLRILPKGVLFVMCLMCHVDQKTLQIINGGGNGNVICRPLEGFSAWLLCLLMLPLYQPLALPTRLLNLSGLPNQKSESASLILVGSLNLISDVLSPPYWSWLVERSRTETHFDCKELLRSRPESNQLILVFWHFRVRGGGALFNVAHG